MSYDHAGYAASFSPWGRPHYLTHAQTWLLERPILNTEYTDMMGCYPLFVCQNPSGLAQDFEALEQNPQRIALVCVAEPLLPNIQSLAPLFPERFHPFKKHYYIDHHKPYKRSKHHRYYAAKALKTLSIEYSEELDSYLDTWCELYDILIQRHGLFGIKAFSRDIFAQHFKLPGICGFIARHQQEIVGMHIWYMHPERNIIYSHLAAQSKSGYALMASYALYQTALNHFKTLSYRYVHLGSGAGMIDQTEDGLSLFKKGWANHQASSYLCGRIFQPDLYQELCCDLSPNDYFPRYRLGDYA